MSNKYVDLQIPRRTIATDTCDIYCNIESVTGNMYGLYIGVLQDLIEFGASHNIQVDNVGVRSGVDSGKSYALFKDVPRDKVLAIRRYFKYICTRAISHNDSPYEYAQNVRNNIIVKTQRSVFYISPGKRKRELYEIDLPSTYAPGYRTDRIDIYRLCTDTMKRISDVT